MVICLKIKQINIYAILDFCTTDKYEKIHVFISEIYDSKENHLSDYIKGVRCLTRVSERQLVRGGGGRVKDFSIGGTLIDK